jgi:hypothetical protein
MEKRLDRLCVVYRREGLAPSRLPELDFSGLTFDERLELDNLLTAPARHQRRFGTPSYAMLTAEERARLDALLMLVKEA